MIIHDTYFIPNDFESCPRLVSKLRGRFRRESGPWGQSRPKSLATMGIQHHQEKGIFWIIVVIIPIIVVIYIWLYDGIINRYNITGWWYTYPSEKYESQLGLLFSIYGKIKFMFQTTNQGHVWAPFINTPLLH